MNVVGLVAALVLSIIFPLSNSFSHDDLDEGIKRVANATSRETAEDLYNRFHMSYSLCTALTVSSLLSAILILTSIAQTSFRDSKGEENVEMLKSWWFYVRWLAMFSIGSLFLGTYISCIVTTYAMRLTMPHKLYCGQLYVEWYMFTPAKYRDAPSCYYNVVLFWITGIMGVFGSLMLLSLGLRNKTKKFIELKKKPVC